MRALRCRGCWNQRHGSHEIPWLTPSTWAEIEICAWCCHGMCQWCARIQPSKNQLTSWFRDVTSFKVAWKYKLQQLVFMYLSSMSIPSKIRILLSSTTVQTIHLSSSWVLPQVKSSIQATLLFPPHGGKLWADRRSPHSWGGQGWEGMCIQHPYQDHFNIAGTRSFVVSIVLMIFHVYMYMYVYIYIYSIYVHILPSDIDLLYAFLLWCLTIL